MTSCTCKSTVLAQSFMYSVHYCICQLLTCYVSRSAWIQARLWVWCAQISHVHLAASQCWCTVRWWLILNLLYCLHSLSELMRCMRAYGSTCFQLILVYLHPFRCTSLFCR